MWKYFFFLFVFVLIVQCTNSVITKVQCNTSDKGTCIEPYCNFTKVETGGVLANYGCTDLTKELEIINVHFKVFVKNRSQYYQLGYFPKIDYCKFIKTFDKKNFLYKGLKLIRDKLPESVHECPYIDTQLQVNNLTLTKDDFTFMPAGKYKVICTFSDDNDYKILKMITHLTI